MEHAILDVLKHVWMAVEQRAPLVAKEVAILNVRGAIQSARVVIIRVSRHARAYVKLLATLGVLKAVIAFVSQVVHLVVLIRVALSALANALVSAIIHASVHARETVQVHLWRIPYTNQV